MVVSKLSDESQLLTVIHYTKGFQRLSVSFAESREDATRLTVVDLASSLWRVAVQDPIWEYGVFTED